MRRYKIIFAVYWLMFAAFSASAARSPGFVRHPESVPYPLLGLMAMCAFLGACVAIFYLLLDPPRFRDSQWRLPAAIAFYFAIATPSVVLGSTTDMPGLYYAPYCFSVLTGVILFVLTMSTVGIVAARRLFKA